MFAKFLIVLLLFTVTVAVVARTSSGRAHSQHYVVHPSDTLWSIAASHYGGDPREGIWKIQKANHLSGPDIYPGERLLLP